MSSRVPPERIDSHRHETGATTLERAVASESAANLGRLGRAVQVALDRLREAPDAERMALEYTCAEAVWLYFVQREACGLRRHEQAIEAYGIPRSVLAKVGARRPA